MIILHSEISKQVPTMSFEEFLKAAHAFYDHHKKFYDGLTDREKKTDNVCDWVCPPGDDPSSLSEPQLREQYELIKESERWLL